MITYQDLAIHAIMEKFTPIFSVAEPGHCMKMTGISGDIIEGLWVEMQKGFPNIGCYILHSVNEGGRYIDAYRLIELRNDPGQTILVLKPTDMRTAAEDSFNNATFTELPVDDIEERIYGHVSKLIPETKKRNVEPILDFARRRASANDLNAYLVELLRCDWTNEATGNLIWKIGFIPDEELLSDLSKIRVRLNFNLQCLDAISIFNQSIHERVNNLPIDKSAPIRRNVAEFLKTNSNEKSSRLLTQLIYESYPQLNFSEWIPHIPDLRTEFKIEVTCLDLRGPNFSENEQGVTLKCPFKKDIPQPVPITIHYTTTPPPNTAKDHGLSRIRVDLWKVIGVKEFEMVRELAFLEITNAKSLNRSKKIEFSPDFEEDTYFFRLVALDENNNELNLDEKFKDPALQSAWEKEKLDKGELADRSQFVGFMQCDSKYFFFIKETDSEVDTPISLERKARVANIMHAVYSMRMAYLKDGQSYAGVKRENEYWGWLEPERVGLHRTFQAKFDDPRFNFQVEISEKLRRLELETLRHPEVLGMCRIYLRNAGVIDDSAIHLTPSFSSDTFAPDFIRARKELFDAILTDSGDTQNPGLIETFELSRDRKIISNYIREYASFLARINDNLQRYNELGEEEKNIAHETAIAIQNLDMVEVKTILPNQEHLTGYLISPLHPLRLSWALLLEELFLDWESRSLKEKLPAFWKDPAIQVIFNGLFSPSNQPLVLSGTDPTTTFEYIGELAFGWGLYLKSNAVERDSESMSSRGRILLQYLQGQFNIPAARLMDTDVDPDIVMQHVINYLKLHPYAEQININLFNAGEGDVFSAVLIALEEDTRYRNLRYEIRLFSQRDRFVEQGAAFNDLLNPDSNQVSEVADAFSLSASNRFQPKLRVSRNTIQEYLKETAAFDAHLSFLVNPFPLKTCVYDPEQTYSSFTLGGLFVEPYVKYEYQETTGQSTWSRFIVPNGNMGTPLEKETLKVYDYLSKVIAFNLKGEPTDSLPATQLVLLDSDTALLDNIHRYSDWVITFDRHLGPEVFDLPGSDGRIPFLLDYIPGEHLLGVSTFLTTKPAEELINLIQPHIQPFIAKISSSEDEGQISAEMLVLNDLRTISGSLILQLNSNPNRITETLGIAFTKRLLEKMGILERHFLIPIDLHRSLFVAAKDQIETQKRADLLLLHFDTNRRIFHCQVIEIKARTQTDIDGQNALMETMDGQMTNTISVIRHHFDPNNAFLGDRFDREIKNIELRELLRFYINRAFRYNLLTDNDSKEYQYLLDTLDDGFQWQFDKKGIIFDLNGDFGIQTYKRATDLSFFVVGKRAIKRILDPNSPLNSKRLSEEEDSFSRVFRLRGVNPLFEMSPSIEVSKSDDLNIKTILPPPDESSHDEGDDFSGPSEPLDKPPVMPASTAEPSESFEEAEKIIDPPLPKLITTTWRIRLGVDAHKGNDVYFDPFTHEPKKLANQHLLIVGKSGAGKSQTTSAILHEIHRCGVPFLILDFQGEYIANNLKNAAGQTFLEMTNSRVLDPSEGIDLNPLQLPLDEFAGTKQNFTKTAYQIAAILDSVFNLGEIQHSNLRNAIMQAYQRNGFQPGKKDTWDNPAPQFSAIWNILTEMEKTEGGQMRNLKLRIQPLFDNHIFIDGSGSSLQEIMGANTIIRLSTLPTVELMRAVSRFTLQSVYNYMLAAGPTSQIRLFVVIDEAHKLSYDQTLTDLIREARKYGIAFILASQSIRDFDTVVFENMGTKIALQLEGDNARYMADNFGLFDKSERERAQQLLQAQQPLRALIRSNHFEPFRQVDFEPFYKK